jgi:hypothetical protein
MSIDMTEETYGNRSVVGMPARRVPYLKLVHSVDAVEVEEDDHRRDTSFAIAIMVPAATMLAAVIWWLL